MSHVLITGMSGAGKTTLLGELSRRGHRTIDTDYDGWVLPDGTWDEARMSRLLASEQTLVVSGTVENQGCFYDRFAAIVLLTAPVDLLIKRVSTRTNNPYGKAESEQFVIRQQVSDVEPLLRRNASLELDGRRPVSELADEVERLVVAPPDGRP
ncbi:AAA family ATPase [Arthrobacter antioxidans]|uniref:AAA family ATPase n=1 Tax=Arthrobacter antioxidans TaxID=2895818 RepID=UPI001FFEBD83|nr:AAA family ATPase [Arthrobacter antioxidans]